MGISAPACDSPRSFVFPNKHVHASAGQRHLRYAGRRLRQANSNSSALQQKTQTTADDATQRVGDGPSVLTAATAAAATAVPATDSAQRHIWVTIGGKRLDATAGGLEYEDGEEVGSKPATQCLCVRTFCQDRSSSSVCAGSGVSIWVHTISLQATHHWRHTEQLRRTNLCRQSAVHQQTGR